MQRDERAQLGRGVFGNRAAELFQLFARGFDGGIETFGFGIGVRLSNIILRHFLRTARNQVGATDGNAFARRHAVQHDTHYSPSPK